MSQLGLDYAPKPRSPRYGRFLKFHRDSPRVYELFRHFAVLAKSKGRRKYFGARMIGERIRWYTSVETTSEDDYRINDHYWPYYARLLMLSDPAQFEGFFERRDAHFDVDDATLLRECASDSEERESV